MPQLSRRDLLKLGVLGTGAALLPSMEILRWAEKAAGSGPSSPSFTPYATPLFIPPLILPVASDATTDYYQVYQQQFTVPNATGAPDAQGALLPGYTTPIWAYGAYTDRSTPGTFTDVKFSLPGPTFKVNRFRNVVVEHVNNLGLASLDVNTTVHFHGGRVRPDSDGDPKDETFSRDGSYLSTTVGVPPPFPNTPCPRSPKNVHTHFYPDLQPAATLWYHDHDFANTGRNVFMGLAGLYVLTDPNEQTLKLPGWSGDVSPYFDVPLAIFDRAFTTSGQPTGQAALDYAGAKTDQGAFGDVIMVNGVAKPFLKVWPRKYRFRILNASNARFYKLSLSNGASFQAVSSDGGLLPSPVTTPDLFIVQAERWNVVIDFSSYAAGTEIILNNAISPDPFGDPVSSSLTSTVMKFIVLDRNAGTVSDTLPHTWNGTDNSTVPSKLADPNDLVRFGVAPTVEPPVARSFRFDRSGGQFTINGLPFDNARIDAAPSQNASEVWEFVNNSGGWLHPIHPHLVEYMVLSRAGGDGLRTYEAGALKDVASLGPNETVHVLIEPVPNDSGGTRTVTDGATTSGSSTVTSASANFISSDVGARITGTGIPVGARILSKTSATQVTITVDGINPATATATATSVRLDVNRSAITVTDGATTSGYPTVTSATANFAPSDVGARIAGAHIPVGARITAVNSASSVTISVNATATATGVTLFVSSESGGTRFATDGGTTSGSPTVSSATANFTAADIGARISGSGIPLGARITGVTSATQVTISANATATYTGVTLTINGAVAVTDGVTTSGSATVTSATANFRLSAPFSDVGQAIAGPGIPANSTIVQVVLATQVTISANATASASSVPLTITQAHPTGFHTPDRMTGVQVDGVEVADAVTTSGSTTLTSATAQFVASDVGKKIGGEGIPSGTTITARDPLAPTTKVTLSAAATNAATGVTITIGRPNSVTDGVTTNGSTTLTSATANFLPSDKGKTITGAGIPPGTWIASINSATSVTMSAAATSTATGVTIVIARGAESVDGCFDPTAAPGAAFTDAVTTYNSYTLTSATANFLSSDVGLSIQGAYIPPGTTIQSRISATQVTLSNNATGSATNVAIVIGRSGSAPLVPYVMHCHNIEHEDNDMMLRWGVLR